MELVNNLLLTKSWLLSSEIVLANYNPKFDVIEYGVGSVISQLFRDGTQKIIAHAWTSLTPVERINGKIEKVSLPITFAIKSNIIATWS